VIKTSADDLVGKLVPNRLKNYRDIQTLLKFETELRAGQAYVSHVLPEIKSLKDVREQQTEVVGKLGKLQSYLDSEVRLVTELIGQTPPAAGEADTINSIIRAYTEVYATMHDNRFVYAFGAVAFKHMDRQAAVPFTAEQFDDLRGFDVK